MIFTIFFFNISHHILYIIYKENISQSNKLRIIILSGIQTQSRERKSNGPLRSVSTALHAAQEKKRNQFVPAHIPVNNFMVPQGYEIDHTRPFSLYLVHQYLLISIIGCALSLLPELSYLWC